MTAPRRRKLIEVALPLEAINRAAKAEKDRKVGKPQQIHHWWARRPIVACRAVLFAQLVDDPSSRLDLYPTPEAQAAKRKELFELIEELVKWENNANGALLKRAHDEIQASCDANPPAIVDPFAGGGAIPLEAQRLGLEVHASDLNPVAVLINKALIEIPPKFTGRPPVFPGAAASKLGEWPQATGLAEDVRRYAEWMRDEAERRIGHLYPKAKLPDGTAANVISWIWARTVTCPNPACGIEMPLARSWWLAKKKGKEAYVIPRVRGGRVEYEIGHGIAGAPTKDRDGTVSRTGAVCVACHTAVPLAYIRTEGKSKRMGTRLMAIVAEGHRRRVYLPPASVHEAAADVPIPDGVPDTDIPYNPRYLTAPNYGMTKHADLFTCRQLTALTTFSDLVWEAREKALSDARATSPPDGEPLQEGGTGAIAYSDSVAVYLTLAVSRLADWSNSLCRWESTGQVSQQLFGRQAISMVWDFSEANTLGTSSGSYRACLDATCGSLSKLGVPVEQASAVRQADARTVGYEGAVLATDPPYYDNVPYADLSDVFYVWQRRSLRHLQPDLFSTVTTPKTDELVADPERRGGKEAAARYFEAGFIDFFAGAGRWHNSGFPASVVYAFKQSESDLLGTVSTGWQTLLDGMIRAGWEITATWPIGTEMGSRMRGQASNALASSVVLACRMRPGNAEATSRRGFLSALKAELPAALKALQQGSIAPVDFAQAAIGPGMAVYSRYSRVVEADGADMTVRTALALINHAVDEVLTEQEGDFDADTRFCVTWFSEFGWNEGPFGRADDLARAKNTSTAGLERGGVFKSVQGKARLLGPDDLRVDWDPLTDVRTSTWEAALHMAKRLDEQGVDQAAPLMQAVGQRMDLDTVKELAYYLYSVCERKGWTSTALLFNGLVTSWLDLEHAARRAPAATGAQPALDFGGDSQ